MILCNNIFYCFGEFFLSFFIFFIFSLLLLFVCLKLDLLVDPKLKYMIGGNPLILLQGECELVKIDINCHIQGDVVLECINLNDDMEREEMMFRVVFNTAFIGSNILMLNLDEVDILWDAKELFPKGFRAEVHVLATFVWHSYWLVLLF